MCCFPRLFLVFFCVLLGCKKTETVTTSPSPSETTPAEGSPPPPTSSAADEISWFHDDYKAALALAKRKNVPLVVDMWAPWCHTCISMKHVVLPDPGLLPLKERFVWVALDTDKAENQTAVSTLKVESWPTFFIINPADETVLGRHLGAASANELRSVLTLAESAFMATEGEVKLLPGERKLVAGDRLFQGGDFTGAAKSYEAAIKEMPPAWPLAPETAVKWISASLKAEDSPCPQSARNLIATAERGATASATDFAYYLEICAERMRPKERSATLSQASQMISRVLATEKAHLSVDDRSDALRILRNLLLKSKKVKQADAAANTQFSLLKKAIRESEAPSYAMGFNWPLLEVAMYLKKVETILPVLQISHSNLPREYDPAYRLASAYQHLGRFEEALVPARIAAELAYGPRKVRVDELLEKIQEARTPAKE